MERLSDTAIDIINDLHTERLDYNSEYLPLIDAAQRLAAYENLEESGRLVVLPCKVGDVLWTYANFPREYIYPFEVRGISVLEKEITTDRVGTVKWADFGKTVFLTRELAEEALSEQKKL